MRRGKPGVAFIANICNNEASDWRCSGKKMFDMETETDRVLITAEHDEQAALTVLEALLQHEDGPLRIVDAHGHEVEAPASLVSFLRQATHLLAQRKTIGIMPFGRDLTSREAANLLNVSRPYLIHLLDEGAIPYTKVGTHRRIALEAVLGYKAKRDAERNRALDELTQLNQEMGLYDR